MRCRECRHMSAEMIKSGRNIWYCMISRTECLPHRIIARSRATDIPTKTAPKWCPLRRDDELQGGEAK